MLHFHTLFRRDPFRIMRLVITALLFAALLWGCGYKGPLYLPQAKPEPQGAKQATKPQQEPQKPGTGSAGQ